MPKYKKKAKMPEQIKSSIISPPQPAIMTLEQKRAKDAWERSASCTSEYANYAKSLPALIMNSGLMQVFAYLQQKGGTHEILSKHLRMWLHCRFESTIKSDSFEDVMESLQKAPPNTYQDITTEAFAWLKWLRQMSSARVGAQ